MEQAKKTPTPPCPKVVRPVLTKNRSDLSQVNTAGANDEPAEKTKRLPPIKAPVGLAKSPDLSSCRSKVGSLNNIKHTPAGGRVQIQSQKLTWNAKSKVGSLDNREHKPAGGNVRVESRKLEWKTSSKVQSLANVRHKPGGGNVKIFNETYRDKSIKRPANGNNDKEDEEVDSRGSSSTSASKNEPEALAKRVQQISLGRKQ